MNSSDGDGKQSPVNLLRCSPAMASSNGVAESSSAAAASRPGLGFSTQEPLCDTLERSFSDLSLLPTPPPSSSRSSPYHRALSPSYQHPSLLPFATGNQYFPTSSRSSPSVLPYNNSAYNSANGLEFVPQTGGYLPGSSRSSFSALPDHNSVYSYSNGLSSNNYVPQIGSYRQGPAPQINRYEIHNGLINNNDSNNSYHFSPAAVAPYHLSPSPSLSEATLWNYYSSSHDREAIQAMSLNYAAAMANISSIHGRNQHSHQVEMDEVDANAFRWRRPAEITPYEGRYKSMDEVVGRMLLVTLEADGSRFLRHLLERGCSANKYTILEEILYSPLTMMADPDGHKVFLKLVEVCPQAYLPRLVEAVLGDFDNSDVLFETLVSWEGSQCMVKLLGRFQHEHHGVTFAMIDRTFRGPKILKLIANMNGHRVIEKVLDILSYDFIEFFLALLDEYRLVDIAVDKSACCSLQKVLQLAKEEDRIPRVLNLIPYTLELSQHPHGNYVVQRLLGISNEGHKDMILDRLRGNIVLLSTQKFSSNVVEACIRMTGHRGRRRIIRELFESPEIVQIMEDPYGNYVIQRALENAEPDLFAYMLLTIKKHEADLESHRYARNILKKVLKMKGAANNGHRGRRTPQFGYQ